jgi:small subunit ribosomal protein S9
MTDDHKDETSEQPVDETAEGQTPQDAGPVAESDSSSSQPAGEEPDSAPPASEAPDDTAPEASAAEDGSSEESAEESDEGSDAPAETAEEPEPVEETPAEEPAAEEASAEEPVAEEAPEEPKVESKKKDVIPGADLEPIAVEPAKQLSAEEKARLEAEEEEKARREAALVGGDDGETEAASREPAKMESGSRFLATGKRKCSIARVILLPGDGKVEINKRSLDEFFPRPLHQTMAVQPLTVSGYEGNVDVRVRVHGGGISGQAGAVRHGIARALTEIDPELRGELKRRGFLTRDARVKERRKAGFKKARKKPQFSKR